MSYSGLCTFIVLAVLIAILGILISSSIFHDIQCYRVKDTKYRKIQIVLVAIFTVALIAILYCLFHWYYTNTASGRREVVNEMSTVKGGLENTVTVYTADGKVLAEYEGQIDIESNDGGYVKFDLDGKRYIYYNCFVESIANIE